MVRIKSKFALVILACSLWAVLTFPLYKTSKLAQSIDARLDRRNGSLNRKVFSLYSEQDPSGDTLREEAQRLLQRAKEVRADIEEDELNQAKDAPTETVAMPISKWSVEGSETSGVDYRLYIDIGREEGSWMDPRWGASGKRIELTLDTRFQTKGDLAFANQTVQEQMVQDNFGGKSSSVCVLKTASEARLRSGFDSMKCYGGGYRIDATKNGATVRFYVRVDGTPEAGSSYGDVYVPKGCLYFSLPCFGNSVSNLSTKEGIVSVRQIGWHTGWRREESRIAGVFRAVPIETARIRDGF